MRTTLDIQDALLIRAKREAIKKRTTLKSVIEDALRGFFEPIAAEGAKNKFSLPTFDGKTPPTVDIADRKALYERMDGRA